MKLNRINIETLDRILITDSQTVEIRNKVNEFMEDKLLLDRVKGVKMPLNHKGVLVIRAVDLEKQLKLKTELVNHFYYNLENGIEIAELDEKGNMKFKVIFETLSSKGKLFIYDKKLKSSKNNLTEIAQHIGHVTLDFMRYTNFVNYLKQDNMIVVKRAYVNNKSRNVLSDTKSPLRAVVSVSKPKKVYDYEEAQREGETRSYERQAEAWEVAGHWRHYKKSGKSVFVKGHRKGEGTKKGKDYKL